MSTLAGPDQLGKVWQKASILPGNYFVFSRANMDKLTDVENSDREEEILSGKGAAIPPKQREAFVKLLANFIRCVMCGG